MALEQRLDRAEHRQPQRLGEHAQGALPGVGDGGLTADLHVTAVRLLGCETAVTDAGQRTLRMLSQTLRLPVFGTIKPLLKSHSNSAGFDPAFTHILVEASSLELIEAAPLTAGA